jgi:hypothetical protein
MNASTGPPYELKGPAVMPHLELCDGFDVVELLLGASEPPHHIQHLLKPVVNVVAPI